MENNWISVEERFPPEGQMVLGYTSCDGVIFVGFYRKNTSSHYRSSWYIATAMCSTKKMPKKVTHWMPLPDPPIGGESVK